MMTCPKRAQGFSALVAVVIMASAILIMTRLAASAALADLENSRIRVQDRGDQMELWSCARNFLLLSRLGYALPDTVAGGIGSCALSVSVSDTWQAELGLSDSSRTILVLDMDWVDGNPVIASWRYSSR